VRMTLIFTYLTHVVTVLSFPFPSFRLELFLSPKLGNAMSLVAKIRFEADMVNAQPTVSTGAAMSEGA